MMLFLIILDIQRDCISTEKEWLYSHNPGRGEEEEGITESPQESEKNKMANLSHQKCNGWLDLITLELCVVKC